MLTPHNLLAAAQELARRNNENAAVHRVFRVKLLQRRRLKKKSPLPKQTLDAIDWQVAKRETLPTRTVGFFVTQKPEATEPSR